MASNQLLDAKRRAILSNNAKLPKIGGTLLGPADLGVNLVKPGSMASRLRTADVEKGRETTGSSGVLGHQPKILKTNMPYKPLSSHNPGRQYQSEATTGMGETQLPRRVMLLPSKKGEQGQPSERGRANFFFEDANSNIFSEAQKQSASFSKEEQEFASASSGKNPVAAHYGSLKASAVRLEEFKFTLGMEQISPDEGLQQSVALSATNSDQLNFTFGEMNRELGKAMSRQPMWSGGRGEMAVGEGTLDTPNSSDKPPKSERVADKSHLAGRSGPGQSGQLSIERYQRQEPVAPHSSPQKGGPKLALPPRQVAVRRDGAELLLRGTPVELPPPVARASRSNQPQPGLTVVKRPKAAT